MFSAAEAHVCAQLKNVGIRPAPYPHFFIENIFPAPFYAELLANLPDTESFTSIAETGLVTPGAYKERLILRFTDDDLAQLAESQARFWRNISAWLEAPRFCDLLIGKFMPHIEQRFGGPISDMKYEVQAKLVRDGTHYALGPHTDSQNRLLTLLFYLPPDCALERFGTSLYVPLDPGFRCKGGPHHARQHFRCVETMPFKPNAVIGFLRTDNSFHGVEPVERPDIQRDLLAFHIRLRKVTLMRPSASAA